MNVCLSARTDIGVVRDHNEDNFSIVQSVFPFLPWDYQPGGFDNPENGLLLLVADGMGGANAGEVASSLTVKVVEDAFGEIGKIPASDKAREEFLKRTIHKAKKLIVSEAKANIEYSGMGTTVVIAWVVEQKCHLAWAGDSRAYLLNKDQKIEIVSKDHSLVWELMEKGMLTEEEAETHPDSNIITQSLSDSGSKLKPDSRTIVLAEGDKLLLCSDGLNGMVNKESIRRMLVENQGNDACTKLVEEANLNGGTDNITVVLMETSPFWSEDLKGILIEEDREIITEKTIKVLNQDWSEEKPAEAEQNEVADKAATTEEKPVLIQQKDAADTTEATKEETVEIAIKENDGFLKKFWNRVTKSISQETEGDDIAQQSKTVEINEVGENHAHVEEIVLDKNKETKEDELAEADQLPNEKQ